MPRTESADLSVMSSSWVAGGKEPLKAGHNAVMVLRDAETIGFLQRWTLPHTFPLKLTGGDGDET